MNSDQKNILLKHLDAFFTEPGEPEDHDSFDQQRIVALPDLKKLIDDFISKKVGLAQFAKSHDLKSREYDYWGFGGFGGQMQLNQYVKNIDDANKETVFRNAIKIPTTEKEAVEKIDSFVNYITDKRAASEKRRALPRQGSVKYVLTYFWEIQAHMKWPIFYNSSRVILEPLDLLKAQPSEGKSYLDFLALMREIHELFKANVKNYTIKYPFWFVEHVLWLPYIKANTSSGIPTSTKIDKTKPTDSESKILELNETSYVPNEWLPPVISDLGQLALNLETAWSKREAMKPEKALETKLSIAFTLLGYETTALGQGTGREPDGFAISINGLDGDYAIIYDAKARGDGFSVGTSDRQIFEYIKKKGEELKKRRVARYYFLIVSSDFNESSKDINLIKDVQRRTGIPIIMIRANDLLFLVEEKLKNIELTHDRLEYLFLDTGLLAKEKIVKILGIRQ